jgi:lysophospholipase L1-like esterase
MRILFIGDSIVKGSVGMDWVARIAEKNPNWHIENAGFNGDTLERVRVRLEKRLDQESYDIIFLQGGMNDLLIPTLDDRGYLFRKASRHLVAKGYAPHNDPAGFEKALLDCIETIRKKSSAIIILTTLSCLSESLESGLNKKRCAYNHIIRDVASKSDCHLVDAGALFDGYLRRCRTKDYLLENFFRSVCSDKFRCKYLGAADYLSRKRGLHLTIDGFHLNSRGANIYRDETEKQVKAIIQFRKAGVHTKPAQIETY